MYDQLADTIDRAGPQKSKPLLVKLALLNPQALGDAERFRQHLQAALRDL